MIILNEIQSYSAGRTLLLLFLALSFLGYYLFIEAKQRIPVALIPGVIVSFITCSLFIAGILNMLFIITCLVFFVGLFLFCLQIINIKNKTNCAISKESIIIIVFLIIVCGYYFLLLHNSIINGYDDFSHWATMVKVMLTNNRLPRFTDDVIMFTSYPPGSSCFIYYFCRIAGGFEGFYLIAQFLMKISYLCSLYCVLSIAKPTKRTVFITSVVILLLSVHNISAHTLSVDGLLSCCGIFCFICVYSLKDRLNACFPIVFLGTSSAILIKNSGVFFYIVTLGFLLVVSSTSLKALIQQKHFRFRNMLVLCAPLGVLYLWQRHVLLVFENGLNAKHSMSINNYMSIVSVKSMSDIKEELKIIGLRIINPRFDHLVPVLLAFLLLYIVVRRTQQQVITKHLVWAVVTCVIYELGTLGMYIFSMPHDEVLFQNGSDYLRYNGSLVTYMVGILFFFSAIYLQNLSKAKTYITALFVAVLMSFSLFPRLQLSDFNPRVKCFLAYKNCVDEKQSALIQLKEISSLEPGGILVRADSDNEGYVYYMMRYLRLNKTFKLLAIENNAEFDNDWLVEDDYRYCIDLIRHKLLVRE